MAILGKLKTQDRVKIWETKGNLLCSLCLKVIDSHDHLFFKCEVSNQIWGYFCNKIGLRFRYDNWNDLVVKFSSHTKGKSFETVIKKLVLAGCVTHIWHERNLRQFRVVSRSNNVAICCIEKEIQMKLISMKNLLNTMKNDVWKSWGIPGMGRDSKERVYNSNNV